VTTERTSERRPIVTILVRARFRVRPEDIDRFSRAAQALATAAAGEVGTLRYAWFVTEDPGTFVVLEEYTDPDTALAHNRRCDQLIRDVSEVATMTEVELHGDLGPHLTAWVAADPRASAHTPLRPYADRDEDPQARPDW